MNATLTAERLRELLSYDPATGHFTWKVSRGRVKAGQQAGNRRPDGYIRINVDGRMYYAHRLACLWMTGVFPQHLVDHKEHDPSDNRWSKIRPATHSQNCANSRPRSGLKGVYPQGRTSFVAQLKHKGRSVHLGTFGTLELAHIAYSMAAQKFYGEFAHGGVP